MAKQTFTNGDVLTASAMTSLQSTAMQGGSTSDKTTSYVLLAADAGTMIRMNAAGSTTITVNNSIFSSGDTVYISNIGAGTTTITAGAGVTINTGGSLAVTQYDGGILYFNSASNATYFDYVQPSTASPLTTKGDLYTRTSSADARLAVGADGTTLVADSTQSTGLKWATASSSPSYVGVGLTKSGYQLISANTTTAITWETESWDTDNFHSTSSNTSRITIPSGKAGKYMFSGVAQFEQIGSGTRTVYLYKNGSADTTIISYLGGATDWTFNFNLILNLAVGDYVEIYVLQTASQSIAFSSPNNARFQATYLGA